MRTTLKKRSRRLKGEGSIFFDERRGTFVALFSLGKDEAGQRIRRKLRAPTRAELQRRIADEKAKGGGSIRARPKGTVAEYIERWLDDLQANRAANTYAQYKWLLESYVVPHLGPKRVDAVDVDDIKALYKRLRRDGVTPSVLAAVATRVRTLFELARRERKILFNPAAIVDKPRHQPRETKYLDAEQAARFLLAARKDRLEAFYVLALTAGLRLGELAGLHWDDVALDEGFLSVRHQLVEVSGALSITPTKTSRSRRRVELGALAIEALQRRRAAYECEAHGAALVFTTPTGEPLRRSNLRKRSFQPIADAAGVPELTIHGLRHACASLMAATSATPKTIQEVLGHATVQMTLDRYSHLLPTLQHEAVTQLDETLSKAMDSIEDERSLSQA